MILEAVALLSFSVLASGSSGNALYIQTDETKVLLDAGISGKQLQARLQETAGTSLEDVQALLLTHEHIDHVRGLTQVLKLSEADVYTTAGTWSEVSASVEKHVGPDSGRNVNVIEAGLAFTIGDLRITPFSISHDAQEPVAYRFDCGLNSLAVVTDLGYMSDPIKSIIAGCQCYVLETNHDVNMLRVGRYPWSVKRRILGDKGHLSNQDAAVALSDLLLDDPVDVYMAHLSEENNQPDLARLTVETVLREIKAGYVEQVRLRHTSRHNATAIHTL